MAIHACGCGAPAKLVAQGVYEEIYCTKCMARLRARTGTAAQIWERLGKRYAERKDCCKDEKNLGKRESAEMLVLRCAVCGERNLPCGLKERADA